jgi:hypothetical protein
MKHVYDGDAWGIFYLPIDDFEPDLPQLGKALDHIQQNHGEVIALIPNIGLTGKPTTRNLLPRSQRTRHNIQEAQTLVPFCICTN